ncbi:MAG TPA: hypothetical protein VJL09_00350 [Candidatus Paceibacterota bacterium]
MGKKRHIVLHRNGRKKVLGKRRKSKGLNRQERLLQRATLVKLEWDVGRHIQEGMFREEFERKVAKVLTASVRRRFSAKLRKHNPDSEIEFQPAVFEIRPSIRTT